MDWYWRFHLDLSPRHEDRRELERIAPELFPSSRFAEGERPEEAHERPWRRELRDDIRRWLATGEARPRVMVREGSCPQHDCPLKLDPASRRVPDGGSGADDPFVIELMTVAGGWSAKARAFFDMTRKVHGGRGAVKDFLVTDPYIYFEQGKDGTAGGTASFLHYLD